tara:strand:+ start:720 stop:1646 length:927 start_codon:yes stop_codon:yes gene_type:complete
MKLKDYLHIQLDKNEYFHFANLIKLCDFYICSKPDHDWWSAKSDNLPKVKKAFPDKNSTIYCYGNKDLPMCLEKCKNNAPNKHIVIWSRTDHPLTNKLARKIPNNVLMVYAHNVETKHKNKTTILPYGIKYDQIDLSRNPKHTHISSCQIKKSFDFTNRKLLYFNFSVTGHNYRKTLRRELCKRFKTSKNSKWITFGHVGCFGKYTISQMEYYEDIYKHKFTMSPQGNGIDCYRTWEAMYLKSIPIVQKSRHMDNFKDLPILFTSNYKEITPSYLNNKYDEMLNKDYNFDKLTWSYWKNKIQDQKAKL